MEDFKIQVQDLLRDLESKTGNKYQLVVQQFGKVRKYDEKELTIGDFENRKIKVNITKDFLLDKIKKFEAETEKAKNATGKNFNFYEEEVKRYNDYLTKVSSFEKINGEYNSVSELRDKIKELDSMEKWTDIKEVEYNGHLIKVGKCKECGKYEGSESCYTNSIGNKITCYSFNELYLASCRNCKANISSIWDNLSVSNTSGSIYYSNGGTMSICYDIGKFELL